MDLLEQFQIASGSIQGSAHRRAHVNNQDAIGLRCTKNMFAAVVCDGVSKDLRKPYGNWTHSEVGAQLCTKWMLKAIETNYDSFLVHPHRLSAEDPFPYWEDIRQEVLANMHMCASFMDGEIVENIIDYFLSTILSVLITPYGTCIASVGDGIYFLNGGEHVLGPYPDNKPPYIAYALTGSDIGSTHRFQTHYLPTDELHSLLIGTDGVVDLHAAAGLKIPGTDRQVGPTSQFWHDDMYFDQPVAVTRQLSMINRHAVMLDREAVRVTESHGLLEDDTSLVVIRRKD
jgi:hypothetical protein